MDPERPRRDKGTGREQKITITATSGLSKEDVERMRRDAEAHAPKTPSVKRKSRLATTSIRWPTRREDAAGQTRQNTADLNQEVEAKIKAVRDALQGSDIDAMRRAMMN